VGGVVWCGGESEESWSADRISVVSFMTLVMNGFRLPSVMPNLRSRVGVLLKKCEFQPFSNEK